MQNKAVNQVMANNSTHTFDRTAIMRLADKIAAYVSDFDTKRSKHHLEIDGYGIEFDYSADIVCHIGGEPDEILCYPENQYVNLTGLWRVDDEDGTELNAEKTYLNYLLN